MDNNGSYDSISVYLLTECIYWVWTLEKCSKTYYCDIRGLALFISSPLIVISEQISSLHRILHHMSQLSSSTAGQENRWCLIGPVDCWYPSLLGGYVRMETVIELIWPVGHTQTVSLGPALTQWINHGFICHSKHIQAFTSPSQKTSLRYICVQISKI